MIKRKHCILFVRMHIGATIMEKQYVGPQKLKKKKKNTTIL